MSNYCFTHIPEGDQYRVVKITENEKGFRALGKANRNDPHEIDKFVGDLDYVRAIINKWNEGLNVSKDREMQIQLTTFCVDQYIHTYHNG